MTLETFDPEFSARVQGAFGRLTEDVEWLLDSADCHGWERCRALAYEETQPNTIKGMFWVAANIQAVDELSLLYGQCTGTRLMTQSNAELFSERLQEYYTLLLRWACKRILNEEKGSEASNPAT